MKLIKKIALLCSAFIFFACGTNNNSETLRMSINSEPDSFFPFKSAAADTYAIYVNIFNGLLGLNPDGSLYPSLAESYSIGSDNVTYTFNLRKGVKFHNGAEFTSADCVYTYENLAGLNGKKAYADKMHIISTVSAPDAYTFVITLKKPAGGFLSLNTTPILLHDYDDNENQPIGTGPYKFVEYKLHEKVVLEINSDYFDSARAGKIKRVELYVMTDENAALAALQSGQIDIAQLISATNAKALEKQFNVVSFPQNMVQVLGMNTKFEPLSDINVRKAITCAVDKKEIINGVFDGLGTELYSNFSPILGEFYNDKLTEVYKYDVELAKKYLSESKFKDGFELTITVPSNYQPHVDTAQIIVNQLSKIGIRARINPVEWTTWLDKVYTKFDYEATVIGFAGKNDPSDVLRRYYSTYKRNFTRLNSSDFDKAFDLAETETNPAKRAAYYKDCQAILTDAAPAVFICDPGRNILTVKNVAGYTAYPVSIFDFTKIYFK